MSSLPANVFQRCMSKDVQGNAINLQSNMNLSFSQVYYEEIVVPANSYFLNLPFPPGASLAQFIAIFALAMTDLLAAIVYNNQSDLKVPSGMAIFLYQANGLWLSSVLGGQCQVVIGV